MSDSAWDEYRRVAWAIDPLHLAVARGDHPALYDGLIELGLLPLEAVETSINSRMDAIASGANRSRLRSDLVAIASQVRHLAARASD